MLAFECNLCLLMHPGCIGLAFPEEKGIKRAALVPSDELFSTFISNTNSNEVRAYALLSLSSPNS